MGVEHECAARDYREIENAMATYAELVDSGDFEGVGELLSSAEFSLNGAEPARGKAEIVALTKDSLRLHDDGTPRTKHLITNISIEVDDAARTATAKSYFTVLQQATDFPLQPIASGRYRDQFQADDDGWHFTARSAFIDLVGDVSRFARSSEDAS
jgi:hypothetical protein